MHVLIISLIFFGSLSELHKTFTFGIKARIREEIKTEKLDMIVTVLIPKTC